METLIVLGGALLFFLLLMVSIALHELGHFSFAKLFGVRTTQFMVGFGPTMWSRRKGETEYGIKWIPLGGYIRMIGMLPPQKGDTLGRARTMRTGPFQGLIDSARGAALEEVRPGDEDRVFYAKKWWQKLIIMFAGPAMNIALAVLFFAILIMGIGIERPQPVVDSVYKCSIPAAESGRDCRPGEPLTPAAAMGLRPGDRFVSYDGRKIESYPQMQRLIRGSAGRTVEIVVVRDGRQIRQSVPITSNKMQSLDDPDKIETVGFLGISSRIEREREGPGAVAAQMGQMTVHTATALIRMPEKMVGVWDAAFGGGERDPQGPIGVVGASRLGGEVAAAEQLDVVEKISWFIMLLAGVNFAVGMFNLIPLLPLDGGHMAGALWEGLKRALARLFRRPDPGYVDVAKALPLTYVMAVVLMVMGALLIYADLVNPIHFQG